MLDHPFADLSEFGNALGGDTTGFEFLVDKGIYLRLSNDLTKLGLKLLEEGVPQGGRLRGWGS